MVALMLMFTAAMSGVVGEDVGTKSPEPKLEVQGHRGARAMRPENTLAAFRYALGVGVDVIELDVTVTKDAHLVVAHDLFLNPDICLDPKGARLEGRVPIRSLTLEALQRYDCGTLRNPRFPTQQPVPGEGIPTLDAVFALLEATAGAEKVRLNIEAKSVPSRPDLTFTPEGWVDALAEALSVPARRRRVTVQSFDHRILRALKARLPDVVIAALVAKSLPDLAELARDLDADIISPNLDWITGPVVKALHAAGVRVIPWTANTEEEWSRLLDLGVDGIITDDPGGLITFLHLRGLR
jgi:glycerophosphoryl diester phosphodiesterase